MKTKRFLICAVAIILAAIVICYSFVMLKPQKENSNLRNHYYAEKIVAAAHVYSSQMKSENQTLPPTISLQELIAKGFLKHEEVSPFGENGIAVTIYLKVDETNPQAVLMHAQSSSDGWQIVA
jgi:hypothetical protein